MLYYILLHGSVEYSIPIGQSPQSEVYYYLVTGKN